MNRLKKFTRFNFYQKGNKLPFYQNGEKVVIPKLVRDIPQQLQNGVTEGFQQGRVQGHDDVKATRCYKVLVNRERVQVSCDDPSADIVRIPSGTTQLGETKIFERYERAHKFTEGTPIKGTDGTKGTSSNVTFGGKTNPPTGSGSSFKEKCSDCDSTALTLPISLGDFRARLQALPASAEYTKNWGNTIIKDAESKKVKDTAVTQISHAKYVKGELADLKMAMEAGCLCTAAGSAKFEDPGTPGTPGEPGLPTETNKEARTRAATADYETNLKEDNLGNGFYTEIVVGWQELDPASNRPLSRQATVFIWARVKFNEEGIGTDIEFGPPTTNRSNIVGGDVAPLEIGGQRGSGLIILKERPDLVYNLPFSYTGKDTELDAALKNTTASQYINPATFMAIGKEKRKAWFKREAQKKIQTGSGVGQDPTKQALPVVDYKGTKDYPVPTQKKGGIYTISRRRQ